jgi:hypothetical protein
MQLKRRHGRARGRADRIARKRPRRLGRPGADARDISAALATATCALLGTSAPAPVVAQEIGQWQFDTAGFYYGEASRIQDLSFRLFARNQSSEDKYLTLTGSIDALTGASPTGAAPSASAQRFSFPVTVTRPSGGSSTSSGYSAAPGELPVDPNFADRRFAGSAEWQRPLGRLTTLDFGGSASTERDYTHFGVDSRIAHDFNQRNTTLTAGFAYAADSVAPIGGVPVALTDWSAGALTGSSSQAKHVLDGLLGVTQVINRHTIAQLNYSVSRADGYLTDPYKILSVVDPVTGDLLPGSVPRIGLYLYEQRPDRREQKGFFGLIKHDFNQRVVVDASFRSMTDDWGIDSTTTDLHLRWDFGGDKFLEPHLRFYSQTAATFYRTVLFAGEPLPAFASADMRLGELDAVTVGLKFGAKTRSGLFSARFELYRQSNKPSPDALVGSLRSLDLTPDLTAVIGEITYRFKY